MRYFCPVQGKYFDHFDPQNAKCIRSCSYEKMEMESKNQTTINKWNRILAAPSPELKPTTIDSKNNAMFRQQPRVPQSCPPAFLGHYTVLPGDTFYSIAQMFRVRIEALAANNPHITNPNLLFPGDVLCVPGFIPYPCCSTLYPRVRVPFGTNGVVNVNFAPRGGQAISFSATLPQPSIFGNFNTYIGEISIPTIGSFNNQLYANPQDPSLWSTRIDLPTAASIMPNSLLKIRPFNSLIGASGSTILEGILRSGMCQSQL
ncbi:LysM domain-containing protein [Clostridium sp. JS66]|uniref:LysM peptidoglycan-binding domain-containing protein n=1 Tax=Clostridium sp. JS66 TaxID=3064705 RepID=UPI00298DC60F|nr:LysM domain-containing protein [Clostridium sp. JS66]WPC40152.1 LysM domain-containing protein [Clostridium sp. JS66]